MRHISIKKDTVFHPKVKYVFLVFWGRSDEGISLFLLAVVFFAGWED